MAKLNEACGGPHAVGGLLGMTEGGTAPSVYTQPAGTQSGPQPIYDQALALVWSCMDAQPGSFEGEILAALIDPIQRYEQKIICCGVPVEALPGEATCSQTGENRTRDEAHVNAPAFAAGYRTAIEYLQERMVEFDQLGADECLRILGQVMGEMLAPREVER
jgi:hypothetical protein